jgi:hypothetical protein
MRSLTVGIRIALAMAPTELAIALIASAATYLLRT